MEPLATIEELSARIEWVLDDGETRLGNSAIEDLSDDARFYGSQKWTEDGNTPGSVKRLILKAVARWLRNPDGYVQSRAGDEAVGWSDQGEQAGTALFTAAEIKVLQTLGNVQPGLYSVEVIAWGNGRPNDGVIYVPTDTTGVEPPEDPFPMFAGDDPFIEPL